MVNTLTPAKVNTAAGDEEAEVDALQEIEVDEEIEINVGDAAGGDEKFIDIRSDADKRSDEEEVDSDPRDEFGAGVDGDQTGRNVAYQSFKRLKAALSIHMNYFLTLKIKNYFMIT